MALPFHYSWNDETKTLYVDRSSAKASVAELAGLVADGAFPGVETVHVGQKSKLEGLPDGLGSVRTLVIESGKLVDWASVYALSSLRVLKLTGKAKGELPAGIGALGALEELRIEAAGIKALPPDLGQLEALTEIWLRHAKIKELPSVEGCRSLVVFSVSSKTLKALPAGLCSLSSLETINVLDAPLTSICEGELTLPKLRSLTIVDGKLRSLPDAIRCPELTWIKLSGRSNAFKTFPSLETPKLGTLSVQSKKLRELPSPLPPELKALIVDAPLERLDPAWAGIEEVELSCTVEALNGPEARAFPASKLRVHSS